MPKFFSFLEIFFPNIYISKKYLKGLGKMSLFKKIISYFILAGFFISTNTPIFAIWQDFFTEDEKQVIITSAPEIDLERISKMQESIAGIVCSGFGSTIINKAIDPIMKKKNTYDIPEEKASRFFEIIERMEPFFLGTSPVPMQFVDMYLTHMLEISSDPKNPFQINIKNLKNCFNFYNKCCLALSSQHVLDIKESLFYASYNAASDLTLLLGSHTPPLAPLDTEDFIEVFKIMEVCANENKADNITQLISLLIMCISKNMEKSNHSFDSLFWVKLVDQIVPFYPKKNSPYKKDHFSCQAKLWSTLMEKDPNEATNYIKHLLKCDSGPNVNPWLFIVAANYYAQGLSGFPQDERQAEIYFNKATQGFLTLEAELRIHRTYTLPAVKSKPKQVLRSKQFTKELTRQSRERVKLSREKAKASRVLAQGSTSSAASAASTSSPIFPAPAAQNLLGEVLKEHGTSIREVKSSRKAGAVDRSIASTSTSGSSSSSPSPEPVATINLDASTSTHVILLGSNHWSTFESLFKENANGTFRNNVQITRRDLENLLAELDPTLKTRTTGGSHGVYNINPICQSPILKDLFINFSNSFERQGITTQVGFNEHLPPYQISQIRAHLTMAGYSPQTVGKKEAKGYKGKK